MIRGLRGNFVLGSMTLTVASMPCLFVAFVCGALGLHVSVHQFQLSEISIGLVLFFATRYIAKRAFRSEHVKAMRKCHELMLTEDAQGWLVQLYVDCSGAVPACQACYMQDDNRQVTPRRRACD